VFITVMRELSLIILLVTPETRTLTTMTFRYQEQGYTQFSSVISALIIIIVVSGELLTRRFVKREMV
jgi:iron(III) transport system permease protein